jgi:hypothetical protein
MIAQPTRQVTHESIAECSSFCEIVREVQMLRLEVARIRMAQQATADSLATLKLAYVKHVTVTHRQPLAPSRSCPARS